MSVPEITLTGDGATGIVTNEQHFAAVAALPLSVKLGRKAPAQKFVPRFAAYRNAVGATPPPAKVDWYSKAAVSVARMYLNDQLGDCVIAGKYHGIGAASANKSGTARVGPDSEVNGNYQRICGPGDNGCVITDVLDDMAAGRFNVGGSPAKLDGYVAIDWTNQTEVMVALDLFGWLTVGVNLPSAWENSSVWDVTNTRIVGGHDITALGYDEKGVYIASWGRIYLITWTAFKSRTWVEELYAPLGPDWYGSDKLAPSGVDAATLAADLVMLKQGQVPPIPGPVVPPSPPSPPSPPPFPPVPPPPDPPAPPVVPPPPAPVVIPAFSVSVSGSIPTGILGHMTPVTLTGVAVPQGQHSPFGRAPLPVILADLALLYAAYKSGDVAAEIAAAAQLAADLKK